MEKQKQSGRQAPERRGRRRQDQGETLSRERLVQVLLSLAATEGGDSLSMRRIAKELGVSPRLLYYHVKNRDELFDLLADTITARCELPSRDVPWRERIVAQQCVLYDALLRYPGVPQQTLVRSTQRFDSPHAQQVLAELRYALKEAGLGAAQAEIARDAIHGYFMGRLMLAEAEVRSGDRHAEAEHGLDASIAFRDGLLLLLDGVATRAGLLEESSAPGASVVKKR